MDDKMIFVSRLGGLESLVGQALDRVHELRRSNELLPAKDALVVASGLETVAGNLGAIVRLLSDIQKELTPESVKEWGWGD